jgi:hypothetical protein
MKRHARAMIKFRGQAIVVTATGLTRQFHNRTELRGTIKKNGKPMAIWFETRQILWTI